ncbi:CapA family protein [Haloimpatiens sp. FM7330]|uniref:CapA family protein n=1 Tax=Haloimpatiens sp. FM7330 TaxID=3298610 RepID=UPI0036286AE1
MSTNRNHKRKHRLKLKNFKRFLFSTTVTLLIIFVFILFFHNITTKIQPKDKNTKNNVAMKTNKNISNTTNKSSSQTKPKAAKKDSYTEILLTSVGDCTLGTDTKFGYSNSLPCVLDRNNKDFSYFFKNVSSIFKADDFTTANLETTFTTANKKASKAFNFKADPEYAKALSIASIDAVNISNNHIHDYLQKGFDDTKTALKNHNVPFFGEGEKFVTTIKGHKFGFLGYQAWSDNQNFLNKIKSDINELKSQGCTIVINFHWGIERNYQPYNVQKNIAHFSIDNGADLIIGHHPHVVQTIEKYKDKIICYSLGNFCFGGNFNPKDKDTFIFQTKFKFKNNDLTGYDTKIIPCSISSKTNINDYCPTPLKGNEKERVLNKLRRLSPTYKNSIKNNFVPVKSTN